MAFSRSLLASLVEMTRGASSLITLLLLAAFAATASANELRVEPQRVSSDESIRITVVLTDSFATLDSVDVPLQNLEMSGPPSTSVEFGFFNGVTSRKKTLSWYASPKGEGTAVVGPVKLVAPDGKREELAAVTVQVSSQPPVNTENPAQGLDQLYMSGKDKVLLTVEVDQKEVYQGAPVSVSWNLYTAESLRNISLASSPKLDDFWVEEIPIKEAPPEEVRVGGHIVQKLLLRKATLFHLRSGELVIPPLDAQIEVVRPTDDPFGGFGMFEGRVADVRRRTAPLTIVAKPLPAAADLVGTFTLQRAAPKVSSAGPVSFDVTVKGDGNVRATKPPKWLVPIDGEVQIEDLGTQVSSREPLEMSRTWRYVIFPRAEGKLVIPGVYLDTFEPAKNTTRVIDCPQAVVNVRRAAQPPEHDEARKSEASETSAVNPIALVASGAAFVGLVVAFIVLRPKKYDRRELDRIVSLAGDPKALKRALHELATARKLEPSALFADLGERGDAWRAMHSLVDLLEKEPESVVKPEKELRRRTLELLRVLA